MGGRRTTFRHSRNPNHSPGGGRIRRTVVVVFILSLAINVGMWFERFVIIVTSLTRDFLPSSWSEYTPTWIEVGTFVGSFGLFFTLFLLFARLLPMIAIAEVKGVLGYGRTVVESTGILTRRNGKASQQTHPVPVTPAHETAHPQ